MWPYCVFIIDIPGIRLTPNAKRGVAVFFNMTSLLFNDIAAYLPAMWLIQPSMPVYQPGNTDDCVCVLLLSVV